MLLPGILPYAFWLRSVANINMKHINRMWQVPTIERKVVLPYGWQLTLFRFLVT